MVASVRQLVRDVAGRLIERVWDAAGTLGAIGSGDARARRFAHMGPGSIIGFPPGAVMAPEMITIGSATLICPHVSLAVGMPGEPMERHPGPLLRIGSRCSIGRGNSIVARVGIDIGDDVTTGPNVYITDHNHNYEDPDVPIGRQWPAEAPVRIGAGCWIGTGAVILPGADIGRNVTVAAASVVRGVVPDRSVVAGAPARVVRRYESGSGWVPPLPTRSVTPPTGFVAR